MFSLKNSDSGPPPSGAGCRGYITEQEHIDVRDKRYTQYYNDHFRIATGKHVHQLRSEKVCDEIPMNLNARYV